MSISSSSTASSSEKTSCSSTTWHVEQASEWSHAPSRSTSFSCAASSRDVPTAAVAGISSPSSMKKKFTVSAGSAGGGA
eukprot:CAMPEP_0118826326 /NCGR_PEP_ID=MMETSP1162-20130426/11879_1 /TAXON_ID=33656 /ORGANISM="Phaeocystis Sp, Strain CCMP2710" /LENGTH=78 /DNA_ID=CAMNT_0006757047 /DNA_START=133 /DNA_END=366 /DNA_ORIENTATION=-